MRKKPLTCDAVLVLGDDYEIGNGITVRQPIVDEIIEYGETSYYKMIGLITCISSDCKATLFDMGLDWCVISDFEMFALATRNLEPEDTSIILGDNIDLSKMEFMANEAGKAYLQSPDGLTKIDGEVYGKLMDFLCKMHHITKKPEFPRNDFARQMLIQENRDAIAANSHRVEKSVLPLYISYIANAQGSKYDYSTARSLKLSTFMDCVSRLQVIGNANALRDACYGGMIDTSKIDKKQLDAMREIAYET